MFGIDVSTCVEVGIEVERAAKALDQRHHAALRTGRFDVRLIGQPTGDQASSGLLANRKRKASGFISLVAKVRGHPPLDMGLIGSEGMLGVTLVLDVVAAPLRAFHGAESA